MGRRKTKKKFKSTKDKADGGDALKKPTKRSLRRAKAAAGGSGSKKKAKSKSKSKKTDETKKNKRPKGQRKQSPPVRLAAMRAGKGGGGVSGCDPSTSAVGCTGS